jgi:fibronectin-binding autotransporter adhesin
VMASGVAVNNITFRNPQSGSFTLTGGEIDLSGALTNTSGANVSIASAIVGSGSLTRSLGGTLSLSGVNTYSGATTISDGATIDLTAGSIAISSAINITDGTLLVGGSDNNVRNSAGVTLGSGSGGVGTLKLTGTVTETAGSLTLAAAGQIIDMGAGAGALTFASMGGSGTLKIFNYTGGTLWSAGTTDRIYISSGSLGSLASADIQFYSDGGSTPFGTGGTMVSGELVPAPEPTAVAALGAILGPMAWRQRRRRQG